MQLGAAFRNRQTEPATARLGREEWFEHTVVQCGGNARAVVANLDDRVLG